MTDTPSSLAEKLTSEGEKSLAFFSALLPEQWHLNIYEGEAIWTPRSILAHFLTAERGFLRLFKEILGGGAGTSPEFSIDRYNARQQQKLQDVSPVELLPQFMAIRTEMIAFVASLNQKDLEIMAHHPALGLVKLAAMIKMIYIHNQQHIRDIRTSLGAVTTPHDG